MGLLARSGLRARGALGALTVAASGCYSPVLRDCTVACATGEDCAAGQVCGSDHFCAGRDVAGTCSTGAKRDASVSATADTSPVPLMHVHVIVVRSGSAELGKWVAETRNVYEDYRRLFGGEPPAELGMRFQINSQHTGTSSESMFADVVFRKQ